MRLLLALYPRGWRRRYGAEFGAVLDEQRSSPGLLLDVVLGAIDAHLDPQIAEDGEDPLRRRMKEVVMEGLRSPRVLLAVGLLLPVAFLVVLYLSPALGNGPIGGVLALATALATGLLVGRWWAPLSFFAAFAVWFASVNGGWPNDPGELTFAAMLASAWAAVCLVGVGVRVLYHARSARLGSSSA